MKRLILLGAIVFFIPSVRLLDGKGGESDAEEPYEQTPEVITDENAGITVRGMFGFGKAKKDTAVKNSKESSSESSSESSPKSDEKDGKDEQTKKTRFSMPKLNFSYFPCSCAHFVCSCQFGVSVPEFRINAQGCVKVTLDTTDFGIHVDIYAGKYLLYHSKVTAVDPPAMCVLLTYSTPIRFCVLMHDIHMDEGNRNLRMCMDFQTELLSYDIVAVPVACLRGGLDGIQIHQGEKYKD